MSRNSSSKPYSRSSSSTDREIATERENRHVRPEKIIVSEQNKQLIEKANELVADGNADEFAALCTDDVKWTILSQGEPMVMEGREAIRDFMKPSAENPDPPAFTITRIIADENAVAACGEMSMPEKDGCIGQYSFCDIYTIKNGQIAGFVTHMNRTDDEKGSETPLSA